MKEVLPMMPEAIYVVDKEKVEEYPEGVKVFALEDLYKKLSILNQRLKKGGCIMITPWGASSVPYGERGIECVLMAMGLKVEIPKHTAMKLMQKAVIARKR